MKVDQGVNFNVPLFELHFQEDCPKNILIKGLKLYKNADMC